MLQARPYFGCLFFFVCTAPLAFSQDTKGDPPADLNKEVAELRALVMKLETRVSELEAKEAPGAQPGAAAAPTAISEPSAPSPAVQAGSQAGAQAGSGTDYLHGTTLNLLFDGYYGYNFNNPIGRDNLLRAYDVSSNSFSLNQVALVLENAPDLDKGKRYGARVDLQFGQATQTLQGNSANEPRPDIYRNIFQLYGTYIVPIGDGLTVDFGKWASSLGIEGNYTKDQMNYSRSYLFDFLPFYHTGMRANYKVSDAFSFNYWVVNGTQQTEAINRFKDQMFGFNMQPHKVVNWTVNYYLGQEHPDTVYFPNGIPAGAPQNLPTLQGTPFEPVSPILTGKLHIFDSYVTWQTTPKFTLALEGDYVVERDQPNSSPSHVSAGALYARYQISPRAAIAARTEYLSDRGGLFSGTTQALKEITLTAEHKFAEGFVARAEYRRDFSNRDYFLTNRLGLLKREQDTATLGLIWWFGEKTGAW